MQATYDPAPLATPLTKRLIVGMVGQQQAGKTTIASQLEKLGWERCSFATSLREMTYRTLAPYGLEWDDITVYKDAKLTDPLRLSQEQADAAASSITTWLSHAFSWSSDQWYEVFRAVYEQLYGTAIESGRHALKLIGTDIVRRHVGESVWVTLAKRRYFRDPSRHPIVFDDCRFPNEADLIHSAGGITIRLLRKTGVADLHESETAQSKIDCTFEVDNNSSIESAVLKVVQILIRRN